MAKNVEKAKKYKAVNAKAFKDTFNSIVPKYEKLSKGESVELDENNKHVVSCCTAWNQHLDVRRIWRNYSGLLGFESRR